MSPQDNAARSDNPIYHPIARRVHWLSAILALVTILLAWCLLGAPRHSAARDWLIMLHGSCGLAILALMVFWGGWRLRHPPPSLRRTLSGVETVLARATQAAIFLLFVVMPVSGYIGLAAAGHPVSLFGVVDIPPVVPPSGRLSQAANAVHLGGEFLIYGLVALHVGAALMHGVRRDGILELMLPRPRL
jgi:cytochrome b561